MNGQVFDTRRFNSFSGCDMVASVNATLPNGNVISQVIGSLTTLTYSIYMNRAPVRALGNVNAKDYTFGPRTIAGTLIFTIFNQHWFHEMLTNNDIDISDMNYLMDELPPFDISITMANEYGKNARCAIYGVRIVSEGVTLSMKDIYSENTYQYVATGLDYLTATGEVVSSVQTVANTGNSAVTVSGIALSNAKNDSTGTKPVLQTSTKKANNTTVVNKSALTDAQKVLLEKRAADLKKKLAKMIKFF